MIHLTIPLPPSVNAMYRGIGKRTILSKEARDFYARAVPMIKSQLGDAPPIRGRVRVDIYLTFGSKRNCDIDNRAKACLDAMTKAGVYTDDSVVDALWITRNDGVNKEQPHAEVTVWEQTNT